MQFTKTNKRKNKEKNYRKFQEVYVLKMQTPTHDFAGQFQHGQNQCKNSKTQIISDNRINYGFTRTHMPYFQKNHRQYARHDVEK